MRCMLCNKKIKKNSKRGVCCSCGSKNCYQLLKEGYKIIKTTQPKSD